MLSARSEVLASLLASLPADTSALSLEAALGLDEGSVTARQLRSLLEYMYTDRCEVDLTDAFALYQLADALALAPLMHRCERGDWPALHSLAHDLASLRGAPSADLTLCLCGQGGEHAHEGESSGGVERVHGVLLCAVSDYFRAMFGGAMVEAKAQRVHLKDCSRDFFTLLVAALYSNGTALAGAITGDNALEYFLLANEYMLTAMQRECERVLKDGLEVESAAEVYRLTATLSPTCALLCLSLLLLLLSLSSIGSVDCALLRCSSSSRIWTRSRPRRSGASLMRPPRTSCLPPMSRRARVLLLFLPPSLTPPSLPPSAEMYSEYLHLLTPEMLAPLSERISTEFAHFISRTLDGLHVDDHDLRCFLLPLRSPSPLLSS